MKNLLIYSLFLFLTTSIAKAQNWGNVGSGSLTHTTWNAAIGSALNPDIKLFVRNADKLNGIKIENTFVTNSVKYGLNSTMSGGLGIKYGVYSSVVNTGPEPSYGLYSTVSGGAGQKYGLYSTIISAGQETNYGVYSFVSGASANNFSGYFVGKAYFSDKVSIGTFNTTGRFTVDATTGTGIFVGNTAGGETGYGINVRTPESSKAFSVGSTGANDKFVVLGNGKFTASGGSIFLNESTNFTQGLSVQANLLLTKAFVVSGPTGENFIVWGNGNVNAKLLYAEGVKVKADALGSYWPDYVFESDYKPISLESLEKYILKYKHLPEIPSTADVKLDGVDLVGMNAALLKKIEELTLYTIDLQKQINKLNK